MASIRQGYLDDYSQQNQNVGIGTSIPKEKLEIHGGVTSKDLNVTGIATLTSASGFIKRNLEYSENVDLDAGNSATLSDEIIVGAGLTMTIGTGATAGQGNIDSLKVYKMFQPPTGGTNQRPVGKPGSLFYNTDFKTVEFFDGNSWRQVDNTTRSSRGILAGGNDPSMISNIAFINITSAGDAQNFGDLITARTCRATSSETRALFAGGYVSPTGSNIIEYVSIASGGNGIDFGDSTHQRRNHAMLSSSTRAVLAGGESPANLNVMDYVEIGTLGNALDFGDLSQARIGNTGMSSPVRGIYTGDQSDYNTTSAEFITIASKGNAIDFGELDDSRSNAGSASNGVRGIVAGGYNGGSRISLVSSCVMASTGNFISFGNLTKEADRGDGMCNSTRAVFNGGYPSNANGMDVIEFSSGGSGTSFGSDIEERGQAAGFCSDSHGGLGGF